MARAWEGRLTEGSLTDRLGSLRREGYPTRWRGLGQSRFRAIQTSSVGHWAAHSGVAYGKVVVAPADG